MCEAINDSALHKFSRFPEEPLVFLPFGVVLGQKYLEGGKPRLVCSTGFRGEASAVSKFTILEFGLPQICLAFSNI